LIIFIAFAVFGSALPVRWDGERGIVSRVVRGGVPAGRYLVARAGAGATIDLVQLTPGLMVAGLASGGSAGTLVAAFVALALSVWIAGLIGALAAALSRSLAETGLVAALAVLLLAHASGVFEEPAAGSPLAALEPLSPFRALHEALVALPVGASPGGMGAALVWAVALPALVLLLGERLTASLGRVMRRGLEGV
jgi:hypothetical protein